MELELTAVLRQSTSLPRHSMQQSDPTQTLPITGTLPTTVITATSETPLATSASWVSNAIYNWGVEPWFGWANCFGNACTPGQLAFRFVRGPASMALGTGALELAPVVGTALSQAEAKV